MTKSNPPAQRLFTVLPDGAGARLDKWLATALPEISRSRLKALIEDGAVEIGGRVVHDAARRIKSNDTVSVALPAPVDATPVLQAMDLRIVHEDEALLVVDKPPGLVVHPAPGNPDHTLVNALLAHCGETLTGIGGVRRPGIVHRIDKDTSGLLVVAKTERAHTNLSAQFKAHSIERLYHAFVWGVPKPPSGTIIGAIGRSPRNRKKMAIVARGKPAETRYATVKRFGDIAAHVRLQLMTGRTHQIRVHMTSRGHGLIGDAVYGQPPRGLRGVPADIAAVLQSFPRQALHAAILGFVHPVTGHKMKFEAPLPDDLVALEIALSKL